MLKVRATFVLIVVLALVGTTGAMGQQVQGDNEIQFQGSLNLDLGSGPGEDSGNVVVTWGRFLTDNHEAGLTILANILADGDLSGSGGPFWRYNFGSSKRVPYVGASLATTFGNSGGGNDLFGNVTGTGDLLLTLEGGVRWFLERNFAFSLAGTTNYDIDNSDFSERLQVLFGFSYFWKK